jgi:HD-GYP domain-containing protein (c-di-GMP phosphodiesterase class II)
LLVHILFESKDLRTVVCESLSTFFDITIVAPETFEESANLLLKSAPDYIVSSYAELKNESIGNLVATKEFKVIVLQRSTEVFELPNFKVAGQFVESTFLREASFLLSKNGAQTKVDANSAEFASSPYIRVGTQLLARTRPLRSDVFIKISELKYIKIFSAGDVFSDEDLARYLVRKGVAYFYIMRKDHQVMLDQLSDIIAKVLDTAPINQEISAPLAAQTTETIHDLVKQVGFTPEVQALVKKNVALVLAEMGKAPSLAEILKRMDLNKDKYITSHSQMLAGVACMLAVAMEWGSEITFKRLTMAALLHDMGITNEALCRVKSMAELNERRAEFTQADIQEYRSHPRRAATLIQGMKEIPADVDRIVHQHHETSLGDGFPEAMSAINIHPLASVLIVAHEMVDWVFDNGKAFDGAAFASANSERFKTGHFKAMIKLIAKL